MPQYTYFIISPGAELYSYVQYQANVKGNYIKFGDQTSIHNPQHAGIRAQYLTHNPDIGVGAIMDATVFAQPYLGTRLKTYITNTLGISPVGNTEWFSIKANFAWNLFVDMQQWDARVLVQADEAKLKTVIQKSLG